MTHAQIIFECAPYVVGAIASLAAAVVFDVMAESRKIRSAMDRRVAALFAD